MSGVSRSKLGVFGGTFDPPHLGHLILASEAYAQLALDQVLWVITGQSPFKQQRALTPAPLRVEMVQAAIAQNAAFTLSRVDLERPPPHYTADTVALLAQQFPDTKLFFLMGADSLHDLPDWHRPQAILSHCSLAVLRRPGTTVDLATLGADLPGIAERIHWVDAPQLEIAARDIRRRVRAGQPIRYFVPEGVRQLIERRQLYQPT